jgi:FtsH-binding integral membrane protein
MEEEIQPVIDYLAALLFSLYIGYDMYRASSVAATFGNAIECALSLFLSIYNLFLSLLSLDD